MVVEIRDWCQNVGEYNTYNFCIWHFGLCVIVSKIDRCRSSDPPYEIAINPIFRSYHVSDVIIQSFLNRSRWNLVHTLVARRARSAISDCLVFMCNTCPKLLCKQQLCTVNPNQYAFSVDLYIIISVKYIIGAHTFLWISIQLMGICVLIINACFSQYVITAIV